MTFVEALIAATMPLARLLMPPGFVRRLDRGCGGLFVLLGARLALLR